MGEYNRRNLETSKLENVCSRNIMCGFYDDYEKKNCLRAPHIHAYHIQRGLCKN